jgi:Asp-tRNA(Asn)/Glu-tRNA(Gln) amidotransferase C subunit
MNETEIKAQAKKIMDEFIKALEKVDVEEKVGFEADSDTRVPKGKKNPEFKKELLKNAPKTKDGCILAEKKGW